MKSTDNNLRAISQEMPIPPTIEITYLKIYLYLPGKGGHLDVRWGGGFKNTYELLKLRALKFSYMNKIHIFQCIGKIFCVEFQRYPLKFHTKYLTRTLKDMIFIQH